jgi:hypothetical protein
MLWTKKFATLATLSQWLILKKAKDYHQKVNNLIPGRYYAIP